MDSRVRDEPAIVVETSRPVTAGVIWLHGLGADGHDFEALVPELHWPAQPGLRFVFPHAPFRPVTLNGGYVMRAWYDIAMSDRGLVQDAGHIRASVAQVRGLIDQEVRRGIATERLVLAGFSQGGAIALHTGLCYERPLAGILSLSAPVPLLEELANTAHVANSTTPVFMAHGTQDPLIAFDSAQKAHQYLHARGVRVEWHAYDMEHTVIPREIHDIRRWLTEILPSTLERPS